MSDFNEFKSIMSGERRFAARFEYIGSNLNNQSGQSAKFWQVERQGEFGPLQVRYGKIGTAGRVTGNGMSRTEALKKARNKVARGYELVSVDSWKSSTETKTEQALREAKPLEVRDWAKSMPDPFCNIVTVNIKTGEALDAAGLPVCHLPREVIENIIAAQIELEAA